MESSVEVIVAADVFEECVDVVGEHSFGVRLRSVGFTRTRAGNIVDLITCEAPVVVRRSCAGEILPGGNDTTRR